MTGEMPELVTLTAAHEAGHVIVGHAVGLIAHRASTRPSSPVDWMWLKMAGPANYPVRPSEMPRLHIGGRVLFRRQGRWRRRPGELRRQHLVACFGGVAAEALLTGRRSHIRAQGDYAAAESWLGIGHAPFREPEWRSAFDKPYQEARAAILANRAAFNRVALALTERGTLDESEIAALLAETG